MYRAKISGAQLQKVHAKESRHDSHIQLADKSYLRFVCFCHSSRVITLFRFLVVYAIFDLHGGDFLSFKRRRHVAGCQRLIELASCDRHSGIQGVVSPNIRNDVENFRRKK